MIDSYEEYDYVHEKVRGKLEDAIAKRNYQVLQWGEVGSSIFSRPSCIGLRRTSGRQGVHLERRSGGGGSMEGGRLPPVVLSSTDLVPRSPRG